MNNNLKNNRNQLFWTIEKTRTKWVVYERWTKEMTKEPIAPNSTWMYYSNVLYVNIFLGFLCLGLKVKLKFKSSEFIRKKHYPPFSFNPPPSSSFNPPLISKFLSCAPDLIFILFRDGGAGYQAEKRSLFPCDRCHYLELLSSSCILLVQGTQFPCLLGHCTIYMITYEKV